MKRKLSASLVLVAVLLVMVERSASRRHGSAYCNSDRIRRTMKLILITFWPLMNSMKMNI